MKKLIILFLTAVAPVILNAQKTPFKSLFDKYVTDPGFNSFQILPGSTSFEWEKSIDSQQLKEMLKNIESVRFLKAKADSTRISMDKIWKNMLKASSGDNYQEVLTVNADKVQLKMFLLKGNDGITHEMALIGRSSDGIMMMTMEGKLDFSSFFNPETLKGLKEVGEYYMKDHPGCPAHKSE